MVILKIGPATRERQAMSEYEQHFSSTPEQFGNGVNAKTRRQRVNAKRPSTVGQARVLAGFAAGMEKRLAAISQLHPQLDHEDIERIQRIDSHVQSIVRSYLSKGKLPDWSKSLKKDIKQFFRLRQLLSQPDARAVSIRLGNKVAKAALSAPRGPADYLAGVIMRALRALGISTELVFNLEFVHGECRENHPLHIHGALCVPDDQIEAVTVALVGALASGYRARWTNVAVLIQSPQNVGFWAGYCTKELSVTAEILSAQGISSKSASYSSRAQTQHTKKLYSRISNWIASEKS